MYSTDDYALSDPYLTGADYSSVQGMNPGNAFTFHLSTYNTGSSASFSFIFLIIYDYTLGAFVFNAGFLPPTTTSITVPAGTLAYGDSFAYEIDYSNRDLVPSPGATFDAQLGSICALTGPSGRSNDLRLRSLPPSRFSRLALRHSASRAASNNGRSRMSRCRVSYLSTAAR